MRVLIFLHISHISSYFVRVLHPSAQVLVAEMQSECNDARAAKANRLGHAAGAPRARRVDSMEPGSLGIPRKTYFYQFFWIFGVFLIKY